MSSLQRSFVTFTRRHGEPLAIFFVTDGFHPIPFLRDRLYLDEIAEAAREESERVGRCTPLLSRVGWHRLSDSTSTSDPGYPNPADEESVEIDVADVE